MVRVAILDYGVGNLFSLKCALERESSQVEIVESIPDAFTFDALILPGVGGFAPVARRIRPDRPKLKAMIARRVPVLGICLGMQLFFDASEEGEGEGLGIFRGKVQRLPGTVKVPHMGWNQLEVIRGSRLLEGLNGDAWVYYVHSFYPEPVNASAVVARTDYGIRFASVIEEGTLFGTQFHPEKSGDAGARMIRNFLAIAERPAG